MRLRRFIYSIAFLLIVSAPEPASASHAAGGELYYEWVSGSTYRLILKMYRDCSGIPEDPEVPLCYYNTCTGWAGQIMLQKVQDGSPNGVQDGSPNGVQLDPGCPGYPTTCAGGSLPGFSEWRYDGLVTLPEKCSRWLFSISIGARNASDNLSGAPIHNYLLVEASLNNMLAEGNSSPVFTVPPVPYVCVGAPYTYNSGALDPDGDSLSFSVIPPKGSNWGTGLGNPGTCPFSTYTFGFASSSYNLHDNPFATGNTFSFSRNTGQMSFTPSLVGNSTVAMLVQEYRNGRLIGSVMRDIQIIKLPCNTAVPDLTLDTASATGITFGPAGLQACIGRELRLCFTIQSPTPGSVFSVSDNCAIAVPGTSVSYTPPARSVTGCISWKPEATDTGRHLITIIVKDSTCSPPGASVIRSFTIPLTISPATVIAGPDTLCAGDSARLTAAGGTGFTWSVTSGDTQSLSCTTCPSPVINPAVTTTYSVRSHTSHGDCGADAVHTVHVKQGSRMTAGPDILKCPGDTIRLPASPHQPLPPGFRFSWSPASYLSDPGVLNPLCSAPVPVTYILKAIPPGPGECASTDTIRVDVSRPPTFETDRTVCTGAPLHFRNTSGNNGTFFWQFGDGAESTGTHASHTYQSAGSYTVRLTDSTCGDTASMSIQAVARPEPAILTDPGTVCQNAPVRFTAVTNGEISSLEWQFGDGRSASGPDVQHSYETAGEKHIRLLATHSSCPDTLIYDTLTVHPLPAVFLGPDTTVCPGTVIILENREPPISAAAYRWNTGASAPRIQVDTPGSYQLTVTTGSGCSDSATRLVSRACSTEFPNAFSPNGDGHNDFFFIRNREGIAQIRLRIFNRWGQELFATNSVSGPGWDGKVNGAAVADGVYIYTADIVYTNGNREYLQGNMTLIR